MAKLMASGIFLILLLDSLAFAAPAIPNRFYGDVRFIDGPAPDDSIIDAKISGIIVASTTTLGGKYGYAPNIFDINDPNSDRAGKTISFFVSGIDTGKTAAFTNGKSSELDLIVNEYAEKNLKTNEPATKLLPKNSGGNISHKNASNNSCTSDWYCSDWHSCQSNIQERKCIDITNCNPPTSRPVLIRDCAKPAASNDNNASSVLKNDGTEQADTLTGQFLSMPSRSAGIVAAILIIIAIILYAQKNNYPITEQIKPKAS